MLNTIATFTTPETISVTPYGLLWALPILFGISIVVKAIKPEVLNIPTMIKDAVKLFAGSVIALVIISIVLGLLVHLVN